MAASSQEEERVCDALDDGLEHDADDFAAALPVWEMPEAVDWCLGEPFSVPACLLPTATDVLEGYPRSLRFLSRLLERLLVTHTRWRGSRRLRKIGRRSGRESSSSGTGSDPSCSGDDNTNQPRSSKNNRSRHYDTVSLGGEDNFSGPPERSDTGTHRDDEAFSGSLAAASSPTGTSQEGRTATGRVHVGDSRCAAVMPAKNETRRGNAAAAAQCAGASHKRLNQTYEDEASASGTSFTGLVSGRMAKALRGVYHAMQSLDFALWIKLHYLLRRPNDMHAFQSFLLDITAKLKTLPMGGSAFLPGGVALAPDKHPVFLLFVVHRLKRSTPASAAHKPVAAFPRGGRSGAVAGGASHPPSFVFAVVNASGFGTEFHAFRLERHPCPGSVQRDLLLVFEDVDPEHLLHSSFWFAVYRMLLVPSPMNLHTLYTIILPHLNRKPLLHNWLFPSSVELDVPLGASLLKGPGSTPSPGRFVCLGNDSAAASDMTADPHQTDRKSAVASAVNNKGKSSNAVGWFGSSYLPAALSGAKPSVPDTSTEAAVGSAALVNPSTLGGCWRPAPQLRTAGSCIQGVQAALVFLLRCYGLPEWDVVTAELYVHLGFCALLLDDVRRLPAPPLPFSSPPGLVDGSSSSGGTSSLQKIAAAAADAWRSLRAVPLVSSLSGRQESGSSSAAAAAALAAGFPFLRPQALLVSFAVRRLARLASDFAWTCGFALQHQQQILDPALGVAFLPALEQKADDTPLRLPQLQTDQYEQVHRLLRQLRQEGTAKLPLECRGLGSGSCSLPPHACTPGLKVHAAAAFPLFGRFRLDVPSPESLAGEPAEPPLLLPVDLSVAAERVEDIEDVVRVLRKTVEACVLLGNQQHLMPHTFCFRFQLIVHLLLRVLPLPLPPTHPLVSQSFWHAVALRRDTQIELLRLLHALARHFACTFFSLPNSRSADAERLIAMAVLCCLADCVLRIPAAGGAGEASTLSLFYSGEADGPMRPFAFDITAFAEESSFLLLYDPIYSTARTQVLDYFNAWREAVPEERIIFAWEKEAELQLGEGDAALLELLAIQWGFDRSREALQLYFSGERPELLDFFPELLYVRDIVFFFKALMTPAADALPALRRWGVAEATLHWRLDPHKGHYIVTAFQKQLHCKCFGREEDYYYYYQQQHQTKKLSRGAQQQPGGRAQLGRAASAGGGAGMAALTQAGGAAYSSTEKTARRTSFSSPKASGSIAAYGSSSSGSAGSVAQSSRTRWLFQRLFYWLGAGEKPRAPPSGADPSNLLPAASRAAGERIMCEDDVLHIKKLPTFGGRLKPQDSELLLQFLTAPYLRIPLVLQFFTEDSRADALVAPALQHVLTAALFEPWHFQHEEVKLPPEVIPPPNQDYLATPLGLLFNELQCSPNTLLSSLAQLLDIAIERDTGSYRGPSATILLFTLRLVARVQSYVLFILRHERYWRTQTPAAPPCSAAGSRRLPAAGSATSSGGGRLSAEGEAGSAAAACLSSQGGRLAPPAGLRCRVHKVRGRWQGWRVPTAAEAVFAASKRDRNIERRSRRREIVNDQRGIEQQDTSCVTRSVRPVTSSTPPAAGVTGTTASRPLNSECHHIVPGCDFTSEGKVSSAALSVPLDAPREADATCCCREPAALPISRNGWAAQVRGLRCEDPAVFTQLQQWRRRLQRRLHGELLHLLERWADKAVADGDIEAACRLHAHIALLFQDYLWEDLTQQSVTALLSSLFFVFTHHNFDVELPPQVRSGEAAFVTRHASRAAAARGVAAGGAAPACAAAAGAASAGLSRPRSAASTRQQPAPKGLGKSSALGGYSSAESSSSSSAAGGSGLDCGGVTTGGKLRQEAAAVASQHTQQSGDDLAEGIFGSEPLGVTDMSLFKLLQQHRLQTLRWLQAHPGEQGSNAVLESIVCTATFTGSRTTQKPQKLLQHQLPTGVASVLSRSCGGGQFALGSASPSAAATAAPAVLPVAREWAEVTECALGGCGRFAPAHASRSNNSRQFGGRNEGGEDKKPAANMPLQNDEQVRCGAAAAAVSGNAGVVATAERRARLVGEAAAGAVAASFRRFVGGDGGRGKSVGAENEKARRAKRGVQIYEEWLRRHVGTPADTEINLQLAELTLRRNPLEMLGTWTNEFDDFVYLFGKVSADSSYQAALVNSTSERLWCRLVGPRHDLQRWHPPRDTGAFFGHALDGFSRVYTGAASCSPEEAAWIPQLLDPWMQDHLPRSHAEALLLMQEPPSEAQQRHQVQEHQQLVRLLCICGYRAVGDGGKGGGASNTASTGGGGRGGGAAAQQQAVALSGAYGGGMPFFGKNARLAVATEDAAVRAAAACGALEPLVVAAGELGAQALRVSTLPLISQYQPLDLDDVAALVAAAGEAEDYHAGGGAVAGEGEGVAAFLLSGAAAAVTELSAGVMRNPSASSSSVTGGCRGGSPSPSSSRPRSSRGGAAARLWPGSSSSGVQQEIDFCILKEVVVRRWPPLLEVYNIVEHGRRLYRQLCYCSDSRLTFDAAADKRLDERPLPCFSAAAPIARGLHQDQREQSLYSGMEGEAGKAWMPDGPALGPSPEGGQTLISMDGAAESTWSRAHAAWLHSPRLCLGVPAALPLTGWNVGPCAGCGAAAAYSQNSNSADCLPDASTSGGRKNAEKGRDDAESGAVATAVAAATAAAGDASRYVLNAARWTDRDVIDETAKFLLSRVAVAPSLVVLRHSQGSASGQREELYVPTRFLRGLVPFCLLEEYEFWQSTSDGTIRGFSRRAGSCTGSGSTRIHGPLSVLYIHLVYTTSPPHSEQRLSCHPEAAAVIQRVPVKAPLQSPDSLSAAGPAVAPPAAAASPPPRRPHAASPGVASNANSAAEPSTPSGQSLPGLPLQTEPSGASGTRPRAADSEQRAAPEEEEEDEGRAVEEREDATVSGREDSSTGSHRSEDDEQLLCWEEAMTLLNLQQAPPGSPLAALAETLRRVEELSYTLVWSSTGRRPEGVEDEEALRQPLSIDLIELPRLGLTFRAQQPLLPRSAAARPAAAAGSASTATTNTAAAKEAARAASVSSLSSSLKCSAGRTSACFSSSAQTPSPGAAGSASGAMAAAAAPVLTKYLCEQHNNLFLSTGDVLRSPLTARLVSGLPHSLLLANDEGDLFVLTPATVKPYRIFRRSSPAVLAALAVPASSSVLAASSQTNTDAEAAAQQGFGAAGDSHSPAASSGSSKKKADAANAEAQAAAGDAASASSPAAILLGRLKGSSSSSGSAHERVRGRQRTDRRAVGMAGQSGLLGGERVVGEADQLLDLLEPAVVHDFSDHRWLRGLSVGGGSSCHHYLYPVHSSRSFLFTPTVASGLHLLLMRYLARQYEEVCRLADAACFAAEARLSPEELQLWGAIGALDRQPDRHPDAHAARLRIWIAANQHEGMYALANEAAGASSGSEDGGSEQLQLQDGGETAALTFPFLRRGDTYTPWLPPAAGRKGRRESGAGAAADQSSNALCDSKNRPRKTRFPRWRPAAAHFAGLGKSARASGRVHHQDAEKGENDQKTDTTSEEEEDLLTDSGRPGSADGEYAAKTEISVDEGGAAAEQQKQKQQKEQQQRDRKQRDSSEGDAVTESRKSGGKGYTPTSSRLRLLRWAATRRRRLLKQGTLRVGAARGVCCWDMTKDLLAYVQKLRFVSAACRLALEEEYELLKLLPSRTQELPEVANRLSVLQEMLRHSKESSGDNSSTSSSGGPASTTQRLPLAKGRSNWKGKAGAALGVGNRETKLQGLEANEAAAAAAHSGEDPCGGYETVLPALDPLVRVDGLQLPSVPHVDDFDAVADRSCLKAETSAVEGLWESCSSLMNSFALRRAEDEPLQGAAALSFVHKWLEKGVRVSDFLVLYELLTNALPLQVLPGESPHIWGALLTRMLPTWDLRSKSRTVSTLRVLMANPAVASCFPQLQDDGRRGAAARLPLGSIVFRTQEPFQKLLKDIQQALFDLQRSGKLVEPVALPGGLLRKVSNHVFVSRANSWLNRLAVSVNVEDYACDRRTLEPVDSAQYAHALAVFSAEQQQQLLLPAQLQQQLQKTTSAAGAVAVTGATTTPGAVTAAAATAAAEEVSLTAAALQAFASQPLQVLDLENLVFWEEGEAAEQRAGAGQAQQSKLPFSLDHHPAAQTSIGKSTIKRLQHEVQAYEEQLAKTRAPCLKGFSSAEVVEMLTSPAALARVVRFLAHLRQRLCNYFVADGRFVDRAIRLTAAVANAIPAFDPLGGSGSGSWRPPGAANAASGRGGAAPPLENGYEYALTTAHWQQQHDSLRQELQGRVFAAAAAATQLNPSALEQLKWAFALGRLGGLEITLSFEYLVALLMSSNAEKCMQRLNPFLTTAMVRDVFSLVGGVMLAVNRRAQLCRCLREVVGLMRLIKKHTVAAAGLRSAVGVEAAAGPATRAAATAAAGVKPGGCSEATESEKRSGSFLSRMVTRPATATGKGGGAGRLEETNGLPAVGGEASRSSAAATAAPGEPHQRQGRVQQSLHVQQQQQLQQQPLEQQQLLHRQVQQQHQSATKQQQYLPPPLKSVVLMLRMRARAVAEQLVAERACIRVTSRRGGGGDSSNRSSAAAETQQLHIPSTAGQSASLPPPTGSSLTSLRGRAAGPTAAGASSRHPGGGAASIDGFSVHDNGIQAATARVVSPPPPPPPPPSSFPRSAAAVPSSSILLEYDPRYLVFEFAYNLLLRRGQVELLETFRQRAAAQQSLCHQMIMGAGKTTVLAPLLALLLADGQRLVAEVIPHALLEFTRSVLRERFSAIIRKGVFTLRFSRFDNVDEQLYLKLLQARDARAVVIMTPTTLKSFLLKALQLLHALDVAWRTSEFALEISRLSDIDKVVHAGRSQLQKLQAGFFKLLGFKQKGEEGASDLLLGLDAVALAAPERLTGRQLRACRRELSLCFRVLRVFSTGVLLIDEVEQILHPLRSELHWPVGRKQPLDLSRETCLASSAVQTQRQQKQQQLPHSASLPTGGTAARRACTEEDDDSGMAAVGSLRLPAGPYYSSAEPQQQQQSAWSAARRGPAAEAACDDSASRALGLLSTRRSRELRHQHSILTGSSTTSASPAAAARQHRGGEGVCCYSRASAGLRDSFAAANQKTCPTLFYDEEENVGLRWKLPWHLLDALFFCYEQRMTVPLTKSREAWRLLTAIRDTVAGGVARRALQTMPHLVLLNRSWYEEHLKLLLAKWMLLALVALRFTGLSDEHALRYMVSLLLHGTRPTQDLQTLPVDVGPSAAARAAAAGGDVPLPLGGVEYFSAAGAAVGSGDLMYVELFEAVESLPEAHVKLLNLSREWLNSLLPHILQKANRVAYGVMTTAEVLQQLRESPSLPRSRQLLAVPFVGKDTPSVASEFSHPDVAIGLTILSYRYQGLRFFDVLCILQEQQERLEGGYGPLHTRVAAKEFVEWVEAAGGLIRGVRRRQCRAELQQLLEAVLVNQQHDECRRSFHRKKWKNKRKQHGKDGEAECPTTLSGCSGRAPTLQQHGPAGLAGPVGNSLLPGRARRRNGSYYRQHSCSAAKNATRTQARVMASTATRARCPDVNGCRRSSSCSSGRSSGSSSGSSDGSAMSDTTTSWEEDAHSTCSSRCSGGMDERRDAVSPSSSFASKSFTARGTDGYLLQTQQSPPFGKSDVDGPQAVYSSPSGSSNVVVDSSRSPPLATIAGGRLARGLRRLRRKSFTLGEALPSTAVAAVGPAAEAARMGGDPGAREALVLGTSGQRHSASARSPALNGETARHNSSSGLGEGPFSRARGRKEQQPHTMDAFTHLPEAPEAGVMSHRKERRRRPRSSRCGCAEPLGSHGSRRSRASRGEFLCSPMCVDGGECWSCAAREAAIESHVYPPDVREHLGEAGAEAGGVFSEASLRESDAVLFRKIWPLELVDLHDPEHADCLYRLLWREPLVIAAYLFRVVFPATLEYAAQQLSASGQEVGGSILFPVRLGFSGTPSDLLPVELGRCQYEAGTDGKMLKLLTDPNVVSYEVLEEGWTVESLLDRVAAAVRGNAGSNSSSGSGAVTERAAQRGRTQQRQEEKGEGLYGRDREQRRRGQSQTSQVAESRRSEGLGRPLAPGEEESEEAAAPFLALIDTGALITGKTNVEVAAALLQRGLGDIEGVVFLDELDRQMVLLREQRTVMKLAQCGVAVEKRFTFYDHVHTTGQDIKQAADATAFLTLGKDSTFRGYAQGGWRMRGIGRGQKIHLLIPPEITELVVRHARLAQTLRYDECLFPSFNSFLQQHERQHLVVVPPPPPPPRQQQQCGQLQPQQSPAAHVVGATTTGALEIATAATGAATGGTATSATGSSFDLCVSSGGASSTVQEAWWRGVVCRGLREICGWLVARGIAEESLQLRLLCQQNLLNVWRKRAFARLCEDHQKIGSADASPALLHCLDIFREKVEFSVPAHVPAMPSLLQRLQLLADEQAELLPLNPQDHREIEHVLGVLQREENDFKQQRMRARGLLPGAGNNEDAVRTEAMEAEVEHEQEQEQEKEQEQEQEVEQEKEEEQVPDAEEAPEALKYSRHDQEPRGWLLRTLAAPPDRRAQGFYPCAEFSVMHKLLQTGVTMPFPEYLLISENHYRPSWRQNSYRRLKNVIIVMEWLPEYCGSAEEEEEETKKKEDHHRYLHKAPAATPAAGTGAPVGAAAGAAALAAAAAAAHATVAASVAAAAAAVTGRDAPAEEEDSPQQWERVQQQRRAEQRQRLLDIFSWMDPTNTGYIEAQDVEEVLRAVLLNPRDTAAGLDMEGELLVQVVLQRLRKLLFRRYFAPAGRAEADKDNPFCSPLDNRDSGFPTSAAAAANVHALNHAAGGAPVVVASGLPPAAGGSQTKTGGWRAQQHGHESILPSSPLLSSAASGSSPLTLALSRPPAAAAADLRLDSCSSDPLAALFGPINSSSSVSLCEARVVVSQPGQNAGKASQDRSSSGFPASTPLCQTGPASPPYSFSPSASSSSWPLKGQQQAGLDLLSGADSVFTGGKQQRTLARTSLRLPLNGRSPTHKSPPPPAAAGAKGGTAPLQTGAPDFLDSILTSPLRAEDACVSPAAARQLLPSSRTISLSLLPNKLAAAAASPTDLLGQDTGFFPSARQPCQLQQQSPDAELLSLAALPLTDVASAASRPWPLHSDTRSAQHEHGGGRQQQLQDEERQKQQCASRGWQQEPGRLRVSLSDLTSVLSDHLLFDVDPCRYFVILTLEEAEGVRAALHAMKQRQQQQQRSGSVVPGKRCAVALRNLSARLQTIDASPLLTMNLTEKVASVVGEQPQIAHACLRFLNSCLLYTNQQVHLLEHVLRPVPCKQREEFFLAVRRCRRRRQHPAAHGEAVVSRLFSGTSVDAAVETMRGALVVCLRQKLRRRGLSASDVYRAFDVLRRGSLTAPQLLAGLAWLGMEKQELLREKQRQLLQVFDLDGDGVVSEEDFLAVVGDISAADNTYTGPDLSFREAHPAAVAAAFVAAGEAAEGVPPTASSTGLPFAAASPAAAAPSDRTRAPPAPSSSAMLGAAGGSVGGGAGAKEEEVSRVHAPLWRRLGVRAFEPGDDFLSKLKFKLQPHKAFRKVWEGRMLQLNREASTASFSQATTTSSTSVVSVWVAEQLESRHRGLMRRNRERVAFGCFACRGGDIHKATAAVCSSERHYSIGDAAAAAGAAGAAAESDVSRYSTFFDGATAAPGESPKHASAGGRSRRWGNTAAGDTGEGGISSGTAAVSGVLPQVLEIIDSSSSVVSESLLLRRFIDTFLPLPSQYRVFWRGQTPSLASLAGTGGRVSSTGGQSAAADGGPNMLTLWIGVPPSSYFTCLGVAATVGSREATPVPDALRCVPRAWVRPTCMQPLLLGDGLFAGGSYPLLRMQQEQHGSRAAGTLSIWSVGEMGLLGASVGGGKGTHSATALAGAAAAAGSSRRVNAGEDAGAAAVSAEQTPHRGPGGQSQTLHAPFTGGVLWGDFVAPAFRLEGTSKAVAAATGLQDVASASLGTPEAGEQAVQSAPDLLTENVDDRRETAGAAALIPRLIPKAHT